MYPLCPPNVPTLHRRDRGERSGRSRFSARISHTQFSGPMVRVLIAPEISGGRRQIPFVGAFRRVDLVSGFLALCLHRRYGCSVSATQNHFSWETETDLTREWFEDGHHSVRVADGPPQRIRGKGQQPLPGDAAWLIGEHNSRGRSGFSSDVLLWHSSYRLA
jgi:hypothetical protein